MEFDHFLCVTRYYRLRPRADFSKDIQWQILKKDYSRNTCWGDKAQGQLNLLAFFFSAKKLVILEF